MAKRFTGIEKWDDPWFFNLDNNHKLAWLFLLDRCNHAGIWNVNPAVMIAYLGFMPSLAPFKGRIVQITTEKWFIPKFIDFQYGTLNPNNRVHRSVLDILEKEGASKPLIRPLLGPKDKDKDKDKDKLKDKEGGVGGERKELTEIQKVVMVYKLTTGYEQNDKAWDKLNFARCTKSAKMLLDFVGTWKDAGDCIEDVYEKLTSKGLTVTLETICKHAADWKKDKLEKGGLRNGIQSLSGHGNHATEPEPVGPASTPREKGLSDAP